MTIDKKIMESWRKHLAEETVKVDEFLGLGKSREEEEPESNAYAQGKLDGIVKGLTFLNQSQQLQLLTMMQNIANDDNIVLEVATMSGDSSEQDRVISPENTSQLMNLIASFNLEQAESRKIIMALNQWGKANTVKFSRAPATTSPEGPTKPTEPQAPVEPSPPEVADDKAADESPPQSTLKQLAPADVKTALSQLSNVAGLEAQKLQQQIDAAFEKHMKNNPFARKMQQDDIPAIHLVRDEIMKILQGDFSNLVAEGKEEYHYVLPGTYRFFHALIKTGTK